MPTLLVVSLLTAGNTASARTPHVPVDPGARPHQTSGTAAGRKHELGGGDNRIVGKSHRAQYPATVLPKAASPRNEARTTTAPAKTPAGYVAGRSRAIASGRSQHATTYSNPDGTQTTVTSTQPVNYRDARGDWQTIRPALHTAANNSLDATGGAAPLTLARKADSPQLAQLILDSTHSVGWRLTDDADSSATVDGATARYPDISRDADLELTAQATGVKEAVVLRSRHAASSYRFTLSLTGLRARLQGSRIQLLDAVTGGVRAIIPAGSMTDADGATSDAVRYQLSDDDVDHPVLTVSADPDWLQEDSRSFPVRIDPTVYTSKSGVIQYFEPNSDLNEGFQVGKDATGHLHSAGLLFSDTINGIAGDRIFGAQLSLVNYNSASCSPRPVSVYGALGDSNSTAYPGPPTGPVLATSSFAYGHVDFGANHTKCAVKSSLINLGVRGRDLVQSWADNYKTDHGLVLKAPANDAKAWKTFAGDDSVNAPKLYITHTPYNAAYKIPNPVPKPAVLQNQNGTVNVTVTNTSSDNWAPADYYLAYRVFNSNGKLLSIQKAATLPYTIYGSIKDHVTLPATIKALPAGVYTLDFTMVRQGGPVFTDEYVPPARLVLAVYNVPPVVSELYPPNGYSTPTLTPQLWAKAVDRDTPTGLSYQFTVTPDGGTAFTSGYITSPAWVPPAGKLVWNKSYTWSVSIKDKNNAVTSVGPIAFLTNVPQPDITGHLSGTPGGDTGDYDPLVGNYTTSAIDAPVVTTGPSLKVARTYNSLDPRSNGLFGAGWSSLFDMHLLTESDGTGNVLVTLDSGREVRFGKNPDGTYVPPGSERLVLTTASGVWTLRDGGGTSYTFAGTGLTAGKLTSITGPTGRPLTLAYNATGQLSTATSGNSGRALTFTWAGAHVAGVTAPPVDGAASTWTYTYDGDNLTKVCGPDTGCTSYGYSTGSHYRSAVLDTKPDSYWRLGESEGDQGGSEIGVNLGKDTATFPGQADFRNGGPLQLLGWPGATAGSTDTSLKLWSGNGDAVVWPAGTVKRNRDGAVELWFKVDGNAFGPLLGYQNAAYDRNSDVDPTKSAPILYVGNDQKLRGQFYTGLTPKPITFATPVDDKKWHHVVLSSYGAMQTMYVDGAVAGTLPQAPDHADMTYAQAGYVYVSNPAAWPSWCFDDPHNPCSEQTHGGGTNLFLDELAVYSHPMSAASDSLHYKLGAVAVQQLTSITLPSGKTGAQITYDNDTDRVSEYTDLNGGTWKVGAPAVTGGATDLRRTVLVRDPADRIHLYEYDALTGQMLRTGTPTGVTTREEDRTCTTPTPQDPSFCANEGGDDDPADATVYDADGLAIRTFTYTTDGRLRRVYNELGNYVESGYDARGNVTARTTCRNPNPTPVCSTTRYTFPTTVTDPMDPRGDKPIEMRDGRSASASDNRYLTKYTYTATGDIASQTTPGGGTTTTTYSTGTETGTDGAAIPSGLPLTTTDARGAVTRMQYNSRGDLSRLTEPSGLVTTFAYDALGRKITETEVSDTYPSGVTTSYAFDSMSRVVKTTGPDVTDAVTGAHHQLQVQTDYDIDGNPTLATQRDLAGNDQPRTTGYDYDDANHVSRVTDAAGNEVSYSYDRFGNQTAMVDPNGTRFEYAYTARNAIAEIRLIDPNDDGDADPAHPGQDGYLVLESMGYDLAGRQVSDTDAMGRTVITDYYKDDLVHRKVLKNFHRPSGTVVDYVLEDDTYDGAGHQTKQVTDNGTRTTTSTYDANGNIATTTEDPGKINRVTSNSYDAVGNLLHTTTSGALSNNPSAGAGTASNNAATSDFGYDLAGRRISQTDTLADGQTATTTTAFDQRGVAVATTSPLGNVDGADAATKAAHTTTVQSDPLQRVTSVIAPAVSAESAGSAASTVSPRTYASYDTFGEQTASKDELGRISTTTYDVRGLAVKATTPAYTQPGTVTTLTSSATAAYDPAGQLTDSTDEYGRATHYTYDRLGHMVKEDAPAGNGTDRLVTAYNYTRSGQLLSTVAPNGARTEATYDDLDRPVTRTAVERYPNLLNLVTTTTYDDASNATAVRSPLGSVSASTYDTADQLITQTDPTGVTTNYGYDGVGHQTSETDGAGRTNRTSYDAGGRVTGQSDYGASASLVRSQSYAYDVEGRLSSATPAKGAPTTYKYDALGRTTGQQEPVSDTSSISTSFGYDAAGQRTRYTDGRGNATIYTYNAWGLPESTIEPATTAQPAAADRTWTTTYDQGGRAVTMAAPGGVTRTMTYDANGLPTHESGTAPAAGSQPASSVTHDYGYDSLGRMTSSGTGSKTNTFAYDDRGLLTSAHGVSGDSTFGYDNDGGLTQRTDGAGTAVFNRVNGRLAGMDDPLTHAHLGFTYAADGQTKSISYTGGDTRTFGTDDLGRINSDTLANGAGATVSSLNYTYDTNNRITNKKTTGFAGSSDNTYTYDDADRLTSWSVAGGKTTTYGYDAAGNRTSTGTDGSPGAVSVYDQRNRLTSSANGATTYAYDPRGNLTTRTTGATVEKLGWDAFSRMTSDNGQTYGYDDLNRLLTRGSASFTYDGDTTASVTDGTQTFTRGPTGDAVAARTGSSATLLMADLHGDIVGQFDPTAATATTLPASRTYDPWGQPTAQSGTGANLGYQGSWTDTSTSQVNMNARWYDPATASFDSRDNFSYSSGDSVLANKYAYAGDDPINTSDPTGNCPDWLCGNIKRAYHGVTHAVSKAWNWTKNTAVTVARNTEHAFETAGRFVSHVAQAAWHGITTAVKWVAKKVVAGYHAVTKAVSSVARAAAAFVKKIAAETAAIARTTARIAAQTAKWAAQEAKRVAIAAKKAVSDKVSAAISFVAQHNPIKIIAAAIKPLYQGVKNVVSAVAHLPAQVVALTVNVVKDVAATAQTVYQTAVRAAGSVVETVSTAASAVAEFAVDNWKDIAAGIAVGLGCAAFTAVTAGAGALACGVVLGAAASGITAALDCPPGQSVAGCAVKGAAIGAASALGGAALGKLAKVGVSKILTRRVTGEAAEATASVEGKVTETAASDTPPPYARSQYTQMSKSARQGALDKAPTCPYCGERVSTQGDHIKSMKQDWDSGGWKDDRVTRSTRVNDPDNLIGACQPCNGSKSASEIGPGEGQWWPPGWPEGEWWPFGGPN